MKAKSLLFGCAAAVVSLALPLSVSAQEGGRRDVRLSDIVRDMEDKGYAVDEIDRDGHVYEVEFVRKDGMRLESIVEIATGHVLRETTEY